MTAGFNIVVALQTEGATPKAITEFSMRDTIPANIEVLRNENKL